VATGSRDPLPSCLYNGPTYPGEPRRITLAMPPTAAEVTAARALEIWPSRPSLPELAAALAATAPSAAGSPPARGVACSSAGGVVSSPAGAVACTPDRDFANFWKSGPLRNERPGSTEPGLTNPRFFGRYVLRSSKDARTGRLEPGRTGLPNGPLLTGPRSTNRLGSGWGL
jgi:hypothetical protein